MVRLLARMRCNTAHKADACVVLELEVHHHEIIVRPTLAEHFAN